MPLLMYFSFLLHLWLGFANFLCLFIFFCFFCVCGFVVPTFYVSLDVLIHLLSVAQFCKRSMPLYYIFFLFFCVCVSVLPMLCASLFVSVALFRQCSMPLYYIFFFVSVS